MRLLIAAWVCASACASPASRKTAPPVEAAGRVERLHLGSLEAYALSDGFMLLPNDGTMFGIGRPPAELGDLLASAGLARDPIRLDVQSLLVKAGDRVILFDTGAGESMPETGRLPRSLALVKVAPEAITDIFISHAHSDHVGGLVTKTGALAFPSATIHMSTPEWTKLQAETEAADQRLVATIAPKVVAFEPGTQVLPMVKAVATPGHTPGHSSYEVGEGTDKLFYLGDVAHHFVISVQRPAWSVEFDGDRPAAEAMRQQTLAKLAAEHTRVFAPHFPFPGVGHVVAHGQGLVWEPE